MIEAGADIAGVDGCSIDKKLSCCFNSLASERDAEHNIKLYIGMLIMLFLDGCIVGKVGHRKYGISYL